jgi:hypothetical protein
MDLVIWFKNVCPTSGIAVEEGGSGAGAQGGRVKGAEYWMAK